MKIGSVEIISSPYVSDYVRVKRSLFERLFSLPWTPLQSHRSVYQPAGYHIIDGSSVVLVSTKTYELLKAEVAK